MNSSDTARQGDAHVAEQSTPAKRLARKRILLGVSGSVAAYKAAIVARLLIKEGASIRPLLTRGAKQFVGEATFSGLTQQAVLSNMFGEGLSGELHVSLAEECDAIVLVPATADLLARMAAGRADDLLAATVLCASCPIVIAPAMHPTMWEHPATKRNVATLAADDRATFVGPVTGEVASGAVGVGRMSEPGDVVRAVIASLAPKDLRGRHLVVSAGPTLEDLDPVRFLGNRSSGKMGFALAERAAARGARVTLVAGPVDLTTPEGVERVNVRSAVEMQQALWQALGRDLSGSDALLMAAAVGDYRPSEHRDTKLKRTESPLELELTQNPDILAEIGHHRAAGRPVLIGFAVETGSDAQIVDYARGKLRSKRVDLVVANHAAESMGLEDNRVTLVGAQDIRTGPTAPKWVIADRILDWLSDRLRTAG